MIVVCPNCSTRFNLPEGQARPGARLRCSVCKHVFPLPEPEPEIEPLPEPEPASPAAPGPLPPLPDPAAPAPSAPAGNGPRNLLVLLLAVLLLAGAAFLYFTPPAQFDPFQRRAQPAADLIGKIDVADVRQYPVRNDQAGVVMVIEGKLINRFGEPRELIRVEATLYGKDGKPLASKPQLAGNTVSLFQLQVLPEAELDAALTSKLGVLSNNTNVQSGGSVPFMVVFCNAPEGATEFGVRVVEARVPPEHR